MSTFASSRVLILNRSYQPVQVTRVERAFGLLYSGAAQALDENFQTFDFESWRDVAARLDDETVRTARWVLRVPRILVLQTYNKIPRSRVRFSRQNIYLRDNFVCQYCAKHFPRHKLNLDHVVPRSQGGRTTWENVVCSCVKCNLSKGGRTPSQAGIKLLKVPKRPSWHSLMPVLGQVPYKEWLPFIDPVTASYWNAELLS